MQSFGARTFDQPLIKQALAQFPVEGHIFEVKDTGSGLFPYVLEDNAYRIALDLRRTWASWRRQVGTSCDELKELGGWKYRVMVDRYAKFATDHLAAAARIGSGRQRDSDITLRHVRENAA